MCENNSSPAINNIKGEFTTRFNNINNIADFDNNPDINTINEAQWIDTPDKEVEFASLVIKGLYLGYGGFIKDRVNQDTINNAINKSGGTAKKLRKLTIIRIYVQLIALTTISFYHLIWMKVIIFLIKAQEKP